MKLTKNIRAGALSTVIVISTLMLLVILGIIMFWDMDMLLFSRTQYVKSQRANIESAYLLYSTHPDSYMRERSEFVIFEGVPSSKVTIEREQWGLYELVSVTATDPAFNQTRLLGLREPSNIGACFYHPDNHLSVTLSGNTNILTDAYLPVNGFIYGQMSSEFFSGEVVETSRMKPAETFLPEPAAGVTATIDSIFSIRPTYMLSRGNISLPFYRSEPLIISAAANIRDNTLAGKIVVAGDNLKINATCHFDDIIVVCSTLTIEEGFEGSMQVFARDSVIVESNVRLHYPSGIYSNSLVRLSDNSLINGYIIVDPLVEAEIERPNYISTRKSLVRGFIYVNGTAHLQGIISGSAFVREAVYYAPYGYYRGMLYDVTLLENSETAYPLWLDNGKRREAKWVN